MFVALFTVSLLCRAVSMLCLFLQSESPPEPKSLRDLNGITIRTRLFTGDSGRLLMFAVLMQAGVYFAGPYFSPYMLNVLEMEYWKYAVLLGVSFVTKFLCLPYWGRYAHRVGAQRMLWIGAVGIIPLSGGWLLSGNFVYLMVLQALGGAAWGAYELAVFLLFFETIPARERTGILTWYNVANSAALAIGSLLGGGLLEILGVTPNAYLWVFAGSSVLRGLTVLLLFRMPRTVVDASPMPIHPLSVQPSAGSFDSPILPAMPDQQVTKSSHAKVTA
jgi:MFS family permease